MEIKVSSDAIVSYCQSCAPETDYIKKLYRVIAAEMEDHMDQNGIAYEKIPTHNPDCEKIFKGNGPDITSPLNGNEYFINKKDPEPLQLTASTGNDVTRIYWYIDDQFYKTTRPGEKQFFIPKEGQVKISCTDDKGRNRNIRITVKHVNL